MPAPTLPGQPRTRHRRRSAQRAVASQNSLRSPVTVAAISLVVEERRPVRRTRCCRHCARRSRRCRGRLRHHVHRRFRRQIAQHPLHVARRGKFARAAGIVADLDHRELHRRVRRHVHPSLGVEFRPRCVRTRCSRIRAGSCKAPRPSSAWAWATRSRPSLRRADNMPRRRCRSPDRCPRASAGTRARFPPTYKPRRPRRPRFRSSRSPARSPMARASPAAASW